MAVTTRAYAILCSDRRITTTKRNGEVLSRLDSDGKSFVLGSHYLAGFSGLATVDGTRMEAWLPMAIAGLANDGRQPYVIASRLTEARRQSRNPSDFTIGVIGVGWRRVGTAVLPNAWLVSNAFDDDDEFDPDLPDTKFRTVWKPTKLGEVGLRSIGEPIDPVLRSMAEAAITQCPPNLSGLQMIYDNLEQLNAAVASTSEGRVGTAIELSAMDRNTFLKQRVGITGHGMTIGTEGGVLTQYRGRNVLSVAPDSIHLPALVGPNIAVFGAEHSPSGLTKPGSRWPRGGQ